MKLTVVNFGTWQKNRNRKDARTAREWVIALPDELDADQRKDLAKDFARSLVDRYDVIADLAIHEPSKGGNDKTTTPISCSPPERQNWTRTINSP